MLPEQKLNTNKTHQQKSGQTPRRRKAQGKADQGSKFVTVIHPEKLKAITTTEENRDRFSAEKGADRASLVSWLFLVGSLMFLFDGLIELTEGISIHVFFHLPASFLFVVGSVLFMPTDKNN